jgi:hypothetical protein
MAQKDAKIKDLEHKLEEKERELTGMKETKSGAEPVSRDRIEDLERRVMEMELLIKGLKDQYTDVMSILRKNRMLEEHTVPRKTAEKMAPKREPSRKAPGEDTARIMQPDGTLKVEKRETEGIIVASTKHSLPPKRGPSTRPGDEQIIIGKNVYEKNGRPVKPVVLAEEKEIEKEKKKKE